MSVVIWAEDREDDNDFDTAVDEDFFSLDFESEDFQEELDGSPMMPWYVIDLAVTSDALYYPFHSNAFCV